MPSTELRDLRALLLHAIASLPLAAHAAQRRSELQALYHQLDHAGMPGKLSVTCSPKTGLG